MVEQRRGKKFLMDCNYLMDDLLYVELQYL